MKVYIEYATKNKKRISDNTFFYENKFIEVEPIYIFRYSCGSGAAQNRFTYAAEATAPKDAAFAYGEGSNKRIRGNINRRMNKQFNPKKLTFEGNRAKV